MRNLAAKDLGVAPVGILEYLNAATGAGYTLDELMLAGERIINAERLFLTKAGFSRKDRDLSDVIWMFTGNAVSGEKDIEALYLSGETN